MIPLEAIADPARLRMLRRLAERGAAGVAELARAAGVHANTARPHLAALEAAGIVLRESAEPRGRGHPPARFRLAPGFSLPGTDFRGLAELLAAALARSGMRPDDLRALGREWGRFLLGRPGAPADPREVLPRVLERLGFQARLARGRLHLAACPCPLLLPGQPELLCRLAAGVVDGVLAGIGAGLSVASAEHDPERRSCRLALAPDAVPLRRAR